jgi:hypothetical protein
MGVDHQPSPTGISLEQIKMFIDGYKKDFTNIVGEFSVLSMIEKLGGQISDVPAEAILYVHANRSFTINVGKRPDRTQMVTIAFAHYLLHYLQVQKRHGYNCMMIVNEECKSVEARLCREEAVSAMTELLNPNKDSGTPVRPVSIDRHQEQVAA